MDNRSDARWRLDGVRVVRSSELDINTAQTPGMNRAAAITHARAGAEKLWAGTVVIHPKAKTGAHHHGPVESVIYVVSGRARMRWGDRLEFVAEAGPGDFIYVPPFVPHQEINASDEAPLSCVLVRSGQEPVVVNLDSAGHRTQSGNGRMGRRPASAKPRVTAPERRRVFSQLGARPHHAVPGQASLILGVPKHALRAGRKFRLSIRAMSCFGVPACSRRSPTGSAHGRIRGRRRQRQAENQDSARQRASVSALLFTI